MRLSSHLTMLALVTGVGCSSHPIGNGNGNGSSDMTINGTGGNGGSGGTGGGGGSGGTGGKGSDMSAVMPMCDVPTQMGCPSGDKCVPSFGGGGGGVKGTCVPVAPGSVGEGQPCTPGNSGNTINDNCAGGLICDNDGPNSTNVCRKICSSDSGCATGNRCGLLFTASYGVCLPTCTAFGAGCPAGNDCSVPFDDVAATQTSEVGFFVCKKTGTVAVWQQCQGDSDCAAGLACDRQAGCFPACDTTHPCGNGPPGDGGVLMCAPLVSQPNGAGYCN
jgi:hypothetical protein